MDYSKATDEQIKVIIEWDTGIPTLLLKDVFEEAMRRKLFHKKITYFIYKQFKTTANTEKQTGLTIEDLIWICYEKGYENIDRFTPTKPFGAYWHTLITREIQTIARDRNAKKRSGNVCFLEDIDEWKIPGGNHTEPIAINRVYIESIMNQLTDIEKEIVIKRYEGYLYSEIGEMQGITKVGVIQRVKKYLERIKGA